MKPIFTIHAGEFLVGNTLEGLSTTNKPVKVWLPTKDTGVDLLVTDDNFTKSVSIQVKYSRDFNETNNVEAIRKNLISSGWWTLSIESIKKSQAHFWIFVLYQIHNKKFDFIIIPKEDLLSFYQILNPGKSKFHSYLTINNCNEVFETRGLNRKGITDISNCKYQNQNRDLTQYLNNWQQIINNL